MLARLPGTCMVCTLNIGLASESARSVGADAAVVSSAAARSVGLSRCAASSTLSTVAPTGAPVSWASVGQGARPLAAMASAITWTVFMTCLRLSWNVGRRRYPPAGNGLGLKLDRDAAGHSLHHAL